MNLSQSVCNKFLSCNLLRLMVSLYTVEPLFDGNPRKKISRNANIRRCEEKCALIKKYPWVKRFFSYCCVI